MLSARHVDGIVAAVRHAAADNAPIRPLGSGHSFSEIAVPAGYALDLRGWHGIDHADPDTGLVTVRSGTTLAELNAALDGHGLAMTNLGDVDAQTLSGAIATGTHGTGARFGGLAAQVRALELVLADGTTTRCSAAERPELFAAARVGLGALGVISTVTLRCEPAFVLAAREEPLPLDEVLERFDELVADNDHFEFFWFPHGTTALVKRNNRLPAGTAPKPMSALRRHAEYELVENTGLGLLCRIGRAFPSRVPRLHRIAGATLSIRSYSDISHRVFVTSRRVRFVESEWAIPRAAAIDVLGELRTAVRRLADPVLFPVEVRTSAPDESWLSTAYGRHTVHVAVHQCLGMPYAEWFATAARICGAVGGRPHWGKMHRLDAAALRERYPRFEDFRRVRAAVDPEGRFRNDYLDRVLGPPTAEPVPGRRIG